MQGTDANAASAADSANAADSAGAVHAANAAGTANVEDTDFAAFHGEYYRYLHMINVIQSHHAATDRISIPYGLGEGGVLRTKLRPGMEVIVADFRLFQPQTLRFQSDLPMVELSFWLKGKSEINLQREQFHISDDHCQLAFMRRIQAEMSYASPEPILACEIRMTESVFRDLIESFDCGSSLNVEQILGSSSIRTYRQTIQPAKRLIVQQLLECPYVPALRKMYMEAKALELLAAYFQECLFDGGRSAGKRPGGMRRTDLDKIRAAADVLTQRMEKPPSLLELSRLVGISDFKLKAGFRELYNTTVFGYLRSKRMERARLLLETERISVYEAAVATGYSNPSHFAAVFRETYGYNPGRRQ